MLYYSMALHHKLLMGYSSDLYIVCKSGVEIIFIELSDIVVGLKASSFIRTKYRK